MKVKEKNNRSKVHMIMEWASAIAMYSPLTLNPGFDSGSNHARAYQQTVQTPVTMQLTYVHGDGIHQLAGVQATSARGT